MQGFVICPFKIHIWLLLLSANKLNFSVLVKISNVSTKIVIQIKLRFDMTKNIVERAQVECCHFFESTLS